QARIHREMMLVAVAVDGRAVNVFHRVPWQSALHATVEQASYVRVRERCKYAPLVAEAKDRALSPQLAREELDGHQQAKLGVIALREIDRAHAAAADLTDQAVRA